MLNIEDIIEKFLIPSLTFIILLLSYIEQKNIRKIEEKRESNRELEKRQAELYATLEIEKGTYKLCILNKGQAEARNIKIKLDDKSLSEYVILNKPPSPVLAPKEKDYYQIQLPMGCNPPSKIEITWGDDSGKDRSRTIQPE